MVVAMAFGHRQQSVSQRENQSPRTPKLGSRAGQLLSPSPRPSQAVWEQPRTRRPDPGGGSER